MNKVLAVLRRRWRLAAVGVAAVALMVVWALVLDAPSAATMQQVVADLGWWAPVVFVLVAAVLACFLVPTSVLNLTAGLAFGLGGGLAVAWLAQLLAAVLGFGVMRARRVRGWSPGSADRASMVARMAHFLGQYPTFSVLVVRAVGIFPFGPSNYAMGFTSVPWRAYVIGTAVGTVPGTAATVAVGASGADPKSPYLWVGVLVLVILAACGTWLTKRRGTKNRP